MMCQNILFAKITTSFKTLRQFDTKLMPST